MVRLSNKRLFTKMMALGLSLTMTIAGIVVSNSKTSVKADSGFSNYDFLKTSGDVIRNNYGKGNNVYLRGTNAGGYMVKENWQNATNSPDDLAQLNTLTNRFGVNTAYNLMDVYEKNYWTTDDFDNCKNLGMSAIRLPFTYMNLYKKKGEDWELRDDAFTKMDWFVDQCSQRGIYVILDLHGAFGSQNGQDHSGQTIDNVGDVNFFYNDKLKNMTLQMWGEIAEHYKNNPAIAAYDTLNEPGEKAGTTSQRHWDFYNQMYQKIRSIDTNHIIIFESCWGTSDLPRPSDYGWTNIMYEYHHYTWNNVSNTEGQKAQCDEIIRNVNNANYGVPTYIGEFTCFEQTDAWYYVLEKFNHAGWHYTNWSYKTTNSGSWGIFNEKSTEKVDIYNDSESEIRRKWGADSIGTGNRAVNGMVYDAMYNNRYRTVVKADKALDEADYFGIKANINAKFACAEDYGEAKVIANRDSAGGWEQFRAIKNGDGTYSFQSRANNKYLCTVFDDEDQNNPVVARSNEISDWEKFYIEKQSDGSVALKTYTNSKYLQADQNNNGLLHANAGSVGTWEKFDIKNIVTGKSVDEVSEEPTTEKPTEAPTQKPTEAPTQKPTEKPTEAPTQKPTQKPTEAIKNDNELISIVGFQINNKIDGIRVLGEIAPTINNREIESTGFIYGLVYDGKNNHNIADNEMLVNSNNAFIKSFASTQKGSYVLSNGNKCMVRTILYNRNSDKELNSRYKVIAYVKCKDGSYHYSDVAEFSINDVLAKV